MKDTNVKPPGLARAGMLLSIVVAALGLLVVNSMSQRQRWNTSNVISQDIRDASSVESPCVNQLVLKGCRGQVRYNFNASHRTLIRSDSFKSEKLLTDVDSFSFSLLRPAPFKTDGELIPAKGGKARAVACSWSCSRKIAGLSLGSEQIHMAAILLRNR